METPAQHSHDQATRVEVRMSPEMRAALAAAALRDHRTVPGQIRVLIAEGLDHRARLAGADNRAKPMLDETR
jgi:hypothetical protein